MLQRVKNKHGLRWTAGLLSLAVLVSGLGLAAAASDDPKQEEKQTEPKKEQQPKKSADKEKVQKRQPAQAAPDPEDIFQNLPQGADPEQLRQMQAEMRRMMEQMRQRFPGGGQGGQFGGPFVGMVPNREGRLGVRVATPSATLTEQLDLPKGQGLVVEDVQAESAAAKAGIKSNDILLELAGKAVPANPRDFVKQLEDIKADAKVDAVVLRKGKRETIKDLTLPEAKAANEPPFFNGLPPKGAFPGGIAPGGAQGGFLPGGGLPGGGNAPGGAFPGGGLQPPAAFGGAGGHHVMTTVFRTDNRFTTRHQEGTLVITVNGTVADGKAHLSGIQVQDGRESHKYESVDKVPEQYRDKVKNLVEMSERSNAKIEIKTPKIQEQ
jgi:hypothetical protein